HFSDVPALIGVRERNGALTKTKLVYWLTTIPLLFFMAGGGVADALHVESARTIISHLGYPDYFMTLIRVAKVLGGIALLAAVPRSLREWAYAGFTFDLIAAAFSHATVGDSLDRVMTPVVLLALTQVSYWAWRQLAVDGQARSVERDLQPARS